MTSFDEIENIAKRYLESKQHKESDSKAFVIEIIDYVSSPDLKFPLQKAPVISNGTTSYLYHNGSTYPNLFKFISQVLHSEIPITVNKERFGPGEIIVIAGDENEAAKQLALSINQLRKLIPAKRSEVLRP
jgi:hypothetical protein